MQTESLGGDYFLIFIDDKTRFTWVYFIWKKINVFTYSKGFKNMVEKKTRKQIKILISNQGGEYTSCDFIKYCNDNAI